MSLAALRDGAGAGFLRQSPSDSHLTRDRDSGAGLG
jgi:hypothetical protein